MKKLLMLLVRGYRLAISPLFPPRCRFLPSCSDYALQAIERHGAVAGGWLALRRFVRCNPFNPGGIDEVPEHFDGWSSGSSRFACLCHRPPLSHRSSPSEGGDTSHPSANS